jgi:hypothetical protein
MFNFKRGIKALQRPIYYKTECLDCELIISVKWERKYTGIFRTYQHKREKQSCPFCNGTHISSAQIRYQDYLDINTHWDMFDVTEAYIV